MTQNLWVYKEAECAKKNTNFDTSLIKSIVSEDTLKSFSLGNILRKEIGGCLCIMEATSAQNLINIVQKCKGKIEIFLTWDEV